MSLLIGRDCQKVTMAHSMGQLVTIGPQCGSGLLHLPSSTSSVIVPDCQEVPLGQLHGVMSAAQTEDIHKWGQDPGNGLKSIRGSWGADLKFVATVATGGRVKFLSAV